MMQSLTLFFFAEFAALAILVPALVGLGSATSRKLQLGLVGPMAMLPLILIAVAAGLLVPNSSSEAVWLAALRLQVLALAFALALTGLTIMLGRPWPLQAPAVVSLLALAALSTPLWGNPLLGLSSDVLSAPAALLQTTPEALRPFFVQLLSAANPLLTVSDGMGYDWMRSVQVIYQHTRIGTDLAFTAPGWMPLTLALTLLGVLSTGVSTLLRDRERPSLYLPAIED